ncbi:MAG: hypothetical protein Q8N48_00660 [Thiobacillus sp.]|nr:hypothetical protein [Thiobacillus sp.]MDP2977322.1 hypothetical protein [Thiobacillus sp.]
MKRKLLALLCGLPWLGACRAGPDPYHTGDPAEDALRHRFRNISIELVVDAVEGAEMERVNITNDLGVSIFGRGVATVALGKRAISAVGSARVPRWVRVTWRKGSGWDDISVGDPKRNLYRSEKIPPGVKWVEGVIAGDYTIPVAERIPDAVLESLRKDPRGGLRIKFRLHPDGVYFGWDIGRRPGKDPKRKDIYFPPGYEMTGGDFKEARVASYLWSPDGFKGLPTSSISSPEAQKLIETGMYFVPSDGKRSKMLWEKGWYIDKDGRKVLTDY